MKKKDYKKIVRAMKNIRMRQMKAKHSDIEVDHGDADELLCNFLCTIGYKELVDEYNGVYKWYA